VDRAFHGTRSVRALARSCWTTKTRICTRQNVAKAASSSPAQSKVSSIEVKLHRGSVKLPHIRLPIYDFMFQVNSDELVNLKSQMVVSSWGGTRFLPYAFTEQAVAMLSTVLRSERPAQVNIAIMRAFVLGAGRAQGRRCASVQLLQSSILARYQTLALPESAVSVNVTVPVTLVITVKGCQTVSLDRSDFSMR
jgi:hypothetical protein